MDRYEIAELIRIRDMAKIDLSLAPAIMAGTQWHADRVAELEWATERLALAGITKNTPKAENVHLNYMAK